MRRYWYAYTGLDGNESDISKYNLITANPTYCPPGAHLCAIYVPSGNHGSVPAADFYSDNISQYLANGKITQTPQPLEGPPYFLYMRE
jgi:hypothetical protein